jgi:hypothetical protein
MTKAHRFYRIGRYFIPLSLIPLGFLAYTLLNLDALNITITHPRVIVEFSSFLALLFIGIFAYWRERREAQGKT